MFQSRNITLSIFDSLQVVWQKDVPIPQTLKINYVKHITERRVFPLTNNNIIKLFIRRNLIQFLHGFLKITLSRNYNFVT